MMKINVIAVGKLKEKYLKDGCDEYIKRMQPFAKVNIIEIQEQRCGDNPSDKEILQVITKEGERIIDKIGKNSFVIPMCIEGEIVSSETFAKKINSAGIDGFSQIDFVIGGSFGLSDAVKSMGNAKISFGKITLPHQLLRVVLLEQTYRAFTINNNIKYHK